MELNRKYRNRKQNLKLENFTTSTPKKSVKYQGKIYGQEKGVVHQKMLRRVERPMNGAIGVREGPMHLKFFPRRRHSRSQATGGVACMI